MKNKPVGCDHEPSAGAPIAHARAIGTVQVMDMFQFLLDGIWQREGDDREG